ncbi:DUF938 domain-containing protein [Shewanella intestini]|uniref:DUF938 domain-containing protein n=1 Tax=Shewanella intestini TaxID=2017544 RepID=A0ABS5I1V4_9GAMM|nr:MULTISPECIES: DUF938 domain-containing protein [Shewanella]MBR9727803.1 DUF938 domain-containing protein [Shewanella intestini]MRG36204.1 DUF938 domain-containing protein [Shewanella sp. XMDDZSB0408]
MGSQLPFSQACENNKQPILDTITPWLKDKHGVLEIGSGTGQHCVYFSQNLPHLSWQPSDQLVHLPHLNTRIHQAQLNNLSTAIELDVNKPWPTVLNMIDTVFTANTLHIMPKPIVEVFFKRIGQHLSSTISQLIIYGPFKYNDQFTSPSNANFELWLQQQYSGSGIRDIEWISELALKQGFELVEDISMPANNQLLKFYRIS